MISKEKWSEIIRNFHEKDIPKLIEREVKIPLEIPIQRSISIIGPRRAGKTYEMFQIIGKLLKKVKKEEIVYINLERADLPVIDSKDLINMLEVFYEIYPENKKLWLFLDEVQNVSNWEKFVRTALDDGIKVFLSGSSSRLLSKEIATSMRGRNLTYTILPFSFKEFLKIKNIILKKFLSTSEKSKVLSLLREYLKYGGYPEAILFSQEKEKILTEIKDTTIYKDVIERSNIRNIKVMKLLINALINSKEFSVNKFYNFLKSSGIKIGKNVLYNYLEYLNDAFFVFPLRKFSYSYKNEEQSIPKVYFIDNGLLTISGIDDIARLMENLVFLELFRRELNISYYQTTNEEIDFVIHKNKKVKQLIQVCYKLDAPDTKNREVKALIKAGKELKCNNLIVISWDYEGEEKIKGRKIKFIPLWKFLT